MPVSTLDLIIGFIKVCIREALVSRVRTSEENCNTHTQAYRNLQNPEPQNFPCLIFWSLAFKARAAADRDHARAGEEMCWARKDKRRNNIGRGKQIQDNIIIKKEQGEDFDGCYSRNIICTANLPSCSVLPEFFNS